MAYTTQQEFFSFPFRNEPPKLPERKRSDGALMTYELCPDSRAWALDKQKRSNYILDVVHKTRIKKAMLHPDGQHELTKDYLVHLDADDLADYILSLQTELKRKNESIQQLELTRQAMGEQLEAVQLKSDELNQESTLLAEERNDFEQQMEELEAVIVDLKQRANRHNQLAKENEQLRYQLERHRVEEADKLQLMKAEVEANFNRTLVRDYEKLEAELVLFKAQYEDLRCQKRELKEQLAKAQLQQTKMADLKRELALEKTLRERIEDELEHLLSVYDQGIPLFEDQSLPVVDNLDRLDKRRSISFQQDEPQTRKSSYQSNVKRLSTTSEKTSEKCGNCENLQQQLENLQHLQSEELQEKDIKTHSLQEQLEMLKNELDLTMRAKDEAMEQLFEIQERKSVLHEASRTEQAMQCDEPMSEIDSKELEALKKANVELQKEMTRLLATQGNAQDEKSESVENQAELTTVIENLRLELQKADEKVRGKEEAIRQLEQEMESVRQMSMAAGIETQQSSEEIAGLKEKLKQCEEELAQQKQENVARDGNDSDDEEQGESESIPDVSEKDLGTEVEQMKTITDLHLELEKTNDLLREKEDTIKQMEILIERLQSGPQITMAENDTLVEKDKDASIDRIRDLEEKLKQCQMELDEQKLTNMRKNSEIRKESFATDEKKSEKVDDTEFLKNVKQLENLSLRDDYRHDPFNEFDPRASLKIKKEENDSDPEKVPDDARPHDRNRDSKQSKVMDESEAAAEFIENIRKYSAGPDSVFDKVTDGFIDGETLNIRPCDLEKTKRIAFKIVRHGIHVLVVAELEHLHLEITKAILYRYHMFGDNVKVIDRAMYESNQIVNMFKDMSKNEMDSFFTTVVQGSPLQNFPLQPVEIPEKLSTKPKPKPKASSAPASKNSGRILIGEYREKHECRTRLWNTPRTPTQTIVASTLADGSRIVARQKKYL